MPQKGFQVRPLGSFGETYLISPDLYRLYRGVSIASYILTLLIGLTSVWLPKASHLPVSSAQILIAGILVFVTGVLLNLNIAARGKIVERLALQRSNNPADFGSSPVKYFRLFQIAIGIFASLAMGVICLFVVLDEIFMHKPLKPNLLVMLALCILCFVMCCRAYRNRK
jgi:hypothetical protein